MTMIDPTEDDLGKTHGADSEKPDPAGAAARLLEGTPEPPPRRGRGRPKKSDAERARARAPGPSKAPAPIDASPPTEAEIAAFAMAWAVLWELVAVRLGKLVALTLPEQKQLAAATIPVVRKYAPFAAEYGPEIALLIAVSGMVISHLPAESNSGAEVVE